MSKDKAIGILGVIGMACISWTLPAFIVAGAASLCILNLEDGDKK